MKSKNYQAIIGFRYLAPLTRADIILVVEDLKYVATSLESAKNEGVALKVLDTLSLGYLRPAKKGEDVIITFYKDKELGEEFQSLEKKNISGQDRHRKYGLLYGYPGCCVDSWLNNLSPPFEKEMGKAFPDYPKEFDYCVPGYRPCSISCEKSKKLLRLWGETLESQDRKAANALRKFNADFYQELHNMYSLFRKNTD